MSNAKAMRDIVWIIFLVYLSWVDSLAQQILWQDVHETNKREAAGAVAVDAAGNIIVVGTTIVEENYPANHDDVLVLKYGPDGTLLWSRQIDMTLSDCAYGVAIDRNGDIVIVGSIYGDSTSADIYIAKYTANGDAIWTRAFTNGAKDDVEAAYGVAIDSKNDIIVVGKGTPSGRKLPDYVTLKYSPTGDLLWTKYYDGGWEDCAQAVAVDDSDNIIVTGWSDNSSNRDWCTVKYTSDGDLRWLGRYDKTRTDRAFGVAIDRESNILVVGETHLMYSGSGGSSGMIVKYSSEGDTIWTKIFTDTQQFAEVSRFVGVQADKYGSIYIAGDYARWDTSGKLWTDYYVAKCSPNSDTVWTVRYNADWKNTASGIAMDANGNIIVTGVTEGNPDDPYQRFDYFTVKLNNILNGVSISQPVATGIFLFPNYPNPFNPITHISYAISNPVKVRITVFDQLGTEIQTLVDKVQQPGSYVATFDGRGLSSGAYYYRIQAGNFIQTKKMILTK